MKIPKEGSLLQDAQSRDFPEDPVAVKGKNDKELYELELQVNSLTERARWWRGQPPVKSEMRAQSNTVGRLCFFLGGDAREYPGGLLRLDPPFAYAEPPSS